MLKNKLDILYYCDSYHAIGIGHLKRGIDILTSLLEIDGYLCVGIQGQYSPSAQDFIEKFKDDRILKFDKKQRIESKIIVIDTMFIPGNAEFIDTDICQKLKEMCCFLIFISSGLKVDIPNCVDVLIDHLPDVIITNLKKHQRIYTGFDYAPVSEEFFIIDKKVGKKNIDILCVIGGAKNQFGPEILLKKLNSNIDIAGKKVSIIVSPHFPVDKKMKLNKKYKKLVIYQNINSLIPFYNDANAVICTYGNATYESLACGCPTYVVAYEQFQYEYAKYLEDKGLIINLGVFSNLDENKVSQINSIEIKERLRLCSKKYLKTSGIKNICNIIKILQKEIK